MTKEKMTLAERKRAKELYLKHKMALLEIEKENYSKLYLVKTYDGWYKMFGHSALFLAKHLNDRVGKNYTLHFDNDYGVRDKSGSISIPGDKLSEFKLRMKYAKINLVREWDEGLEFEIGERLTEEDVVRMEQEDEHIAAKANELVLPHAIMPELRVQVKDMTRMVHELISNQSKLAKTAFLFDFEKEAVEMNMLVIAMGRGAIEIDICLEKLLEMVEMMYEYATVVADLDLIPPKKFYRVVKKIRSVEDQIKREIKKQTIRKVDSGRKKAKRPTKMDAKSKRLSSAKEKEAK